MSAADGGTSRERSIGKVRTSLKCRLFAKTLGFKAFHFAACSGLLERTVPDSRGIASAAQRRDRSRIQRINQPLDERRFTDPAAKLSFMWWQAANLRIEAAESRIDSRSPGD